MGDTIRIQMMNTFTIYINEIQADHMVNKSRKGVALMQYLILNREQPVPNQRLLAALWSEEKSAQNAGQPPARAAQPAFARAGPGHCGGSQRLPLAAIAGHVGGRLRN